MRHKLAGWGASIAGLFLIAGCASQQPDHQSIEDIEAARDAMLAAMALNTHPDSQSFGSCVGKPGTGGVLSYSKSSDTYILNLFRQGKGEITATPNKEGELNRQFDKLHAHCFPE